MKYVVNRFFIIFTSVAVLWTAYAGDHKIPTAFTNEDKLSFSDSLFHGCILIRGKCFVNRKKVVKKLSTDIHRLSPEWIIRKELKTNDLMFFNRGQTTTTI